MNTTVKECKIERLMRQEKILKYLRTLLILIMCISSFQLFFGQSYLKSQKSIGGPGWIYYTHYIPTIKTKTGYITAVNYNGNKGFEKTTDSFDPFDVWIVAYDSVGNKQWERLYGGSNYDLVNGIVPTKDGGYAVSILTKSNNSGNMPYSNYGDYDIWILKLDSIGNKIWDKRYGTNTHDHLAECIIEDKSGNIIFGTYSDGGISGNRTAPKRGTSADFWMIKLDKNGNEIWQKSFGANGTNLVDKLILADNNTFLICGYTTADSTVDMSHHSKGGRDIWIIKVDSSGNKIWDKNYGSSGDDIFDEGVLYKNNIYIAGQIMPTVSDGDITPDNNGQLSLWLLKLDTAGNKLWDRRIGGSSTDDIIHSIEHDIDDNIYIGASSNSNVSAFKSIGAHSVNKYDYWMLKLNPNGQKIWDQTVGGDDIDDLSRAFLKQNSILMVGCSWSDSNSYDRKVKRKGSTDIWLCEINLPKKTIHGKVFPDFNANCTYNIGSEYNIKNIIIQNTLENTYTISNDTGYTTYLYQYDSALLKIVNLDTNIMVSCGRDSIKVKFINIDTSHIDFPLKAKKNGHCPKITSSSHSFLRVGRWATYQICYQNFSMDSAHNAYIDLEIDSTKIDSFYTNVSYTKVGKKIRFQLGTLPPFSSGCIIYYVKIKMNVRWLGICHRAVISPNCNVQKKGKDDSCRIEMAVTCISKDTIALELINLGPNNQGKPGVVKSYEDIIIMRIDSFKLNIGNSKIFKYKLDSNKVFTAEVFNNNGDAIYPELIRHDDVCAFAMAPPQQNPILRFNRHDDAIEYEEDCDIIRGSYDPNRKSVIPAGMFSENYTNVGTELKYRIDFQNTGTDTAFKVILVDTLSEYLDIATLIPGASSHSYSTEIVGRALKFIFDPIILPDSNINEIESHGYVTFKIKHNQGLAPKTRIENKVDIYFDFNAAVRTNTVFNTIFDTIQIYIPKATDTVVSKDSTLSILSTYNEPIIIYPNPTTDKVYINLSDMVKNLKMELTDATGRLISNLKVYHQRTSELNLEGLPKGVYILRCIGSDGVIAIRKIELR